MTPASRPIRKRLLLRAIVAIALGSPLAALGDYPYPTQEEFNLLPPWCRWTQLAPKFDKQRYATAVKEYGRSWEHMHHHCWALIDVGRMYRFSTSPRERIAFAKRALSNFDYVLRGSPAGEFTPRAIVLSEKTQLLIRIDRIIEARQTASQLVEEWPNFGDGYLHLANILIRLGETDEATRILERGATMATDPDEFRRKRSLLGK